MTTNIFETIGIPVDYVILGIAVIQIIFIILIITALVKLRKMKKNYNTFLSGNDGKSLEEVILKKFDIISLLNESIKDIYAQLKDIDRNMLLTFQKMGLVKYDAFKEVGGRMSFVLVLLSKENNGIIMNCMHSNSEGCYTYVKRVVSGNVKAALSKEEELALKQAMNYKTEQEEE